MSRVFASRLWPVCILVGLVLAAGSYASWLNTLYYELHPPFYDSLSYTTTLDMVMQTSRERGLAAAMGSLGQNTVFLPWLTGALVAPFLEPSRQLAVWYQTGWLLVLCLVWYWHLIRFRDCQPWTSVLLIAPMLALQCLYHFNGGLSDFRMDLLFAMMYCLCGILFLSTDYRSSYTLWASLGAVAACALLSRATAPVFLIVGLLPPIAARLWRSRERLRLLRRVGVAVFVAALLAGWFYVVNFDYLHFYYMVWNPDANRDLTLLQSAAHFGFALRSIGFPVLALGCAWAAMKILTVRDTGVGDVLRRMDWAALWIAVSPALFLVLRGAGHNPFVSMPSAFAGYVFLVMPATGALSSSRPSSLALVAAGPLVLAVAIASGVDSHRDASTGDMSAHRAVIDSVVRDATEREVTEVSIGVLHLYGFNFASVLNVMRYDYDSVAAGHGVRMNGVTYRPVNTTVGATRAWLEGDEKKAIESLNTLITEKVDYLVVPTPATIDFLEMSVSHNPINTQVRGLARDLFANGSWKAITGELAGSPDEVVVVYRNDARR